MRASRAAVVLVLALVTFVACGGGGNGGQGFETVQDVVDALMAGGVDCTNLQLDDPTLGAREEGSCSVGDEDLDIAIYRDKRTIDDLFKAFGGLATGFLIVGPTWVVNAQRRATAESVREVIGGEIR